MPLLYNEIIINMIVLYLDDKQVICLACTASLAAIILYIFYLGVESQMHRFGHDSGHGEGTD